MKNFFLNIEAATAIEYGLIIGALAVFVIISVFFLGEYIDGFFEFLSEMVTNLLSSQETLE